jgi:hypothetical protein
MEVDVPRDSPLVPGCVAAGPSAGEVDVPAPIPAQRRGRKRRAELPDHGGLVLWLVIEAEGLRGRDVATTQSAALGRLQLVGCALGDWELTRADLFDLPQCAEEAAMVGKGPGKQKFSSLASWGL